MKKIIFWFCIGLFLSMCLFIEWAVNGLSDFPYLEKKFSEQTELATDGGEPEKELNRFTNGVVTGAMVVYASTAAMITTVFNEKHKK